MKYRKRPVEIEAIRYDGKNSDEVKEFCEKFPFIKETTLRWQIHQKEVLGVSEAFIKPFGQRKILVDVRQYFKKMREKKRGR